MIDEARQVVEAYRRLVWRRKRGTPEQVAEAIGNLEAACARLADAQELREKGGQQSLISRS